MPRHAVLCCVLCSQVDGATGTKFQSVAELIAAEKAARAARRGGPAAVVVDEEEKVCVCVDVAGHTVAQ